MKNLRTIIPALLLLGAAVYFGYYYFWLEDDERAIHGRVDRLVELASKDGEETVFVGIGRARDIADHFAGEVRLDMGRPFPSGRADRDELTAAIGQARANVDQLRLRVSDRELEIDDDGRRAVMELTGHGDLTARQGQGREVRRFRVEWVKEDGEWLIEKIELLDILN